MAYSLRKHFNLQFQALTAKGTLGPLQSLGIGYSPCLCTSETEDPNCKNKFAYVRDWVGKKPITIRECPNKFDDSDIWPQIQTALWEVKDWDKVLGFYGVPVVHLSLLRYNMIKMSCEARDRYHAQKYQKEG